jgi:hypothetical protein
MVFGGGRLCALGILFLVCHPVVRASSSIVYTSTRTASSPPIDRNGSPFCTAVLRCPPRLRRSRRSREAGLQPREARKTLCTQSERRPQLAPGRKCDAEQLYNQAEHRNTAAGQGLPSLPPPPPPASVLTSFLPKPFDLTLETGSSDLWVPSVEDSVCTAGDNVCTFGTYDPTASSTYSLVDQGQFAIQ